MAEITRRRVGELMRGVFQVLLSSSEGLKAKEVLARVQTVVPPRPFESSDYSKPLVPYVFSLDGIGQNSQQTRKRCD